MSDVFERAAHVVEQERRLLEGEPLEASLGTEPRAAGTDSTGSRADLAVANATFDPARLVPGTRFRRLKGAILRALAIYTNGQVSFNAAVVRHLNEWEERFLLIENRGRQRIALAEQRRIIWESRLRSDLKSLEVRVGELESALAAAEAQLKERQKT